MLYFSWMQILFNFFTYKTLILETIKYCIRIRFCKYCKHRIRIRICKYLKSWIRIRMKWMWIRNPACMPLFFANWLAALDLPYKFYLFFVECLWQETLIGQACAGMLQRLISESSSHFISLYMKSIPFGKNGKTPPSHLLGPDLHALSIRARSILWESPFKLLNYLYTVLENLGGIGFQLIWGTVFSYMWKCADVQFQCKTLTYCSYKNLHSIPFKFSCFFHTITLFLEFSLRSFLANCYSYRAQKESVGVFCPCSWIFLYNCAGGVWLNFATANDYCQSVNIIILAFIWLKSSVPDPDPDPDPDPPGSEIIWPQGSRSGSEIIWPQGSGSGSFPFSHQT